MSEPVELGSGIEYNRVTGKFQVLKGGHWVDLDATVIYGLVASLAALDPTTLKGVSGVAAGYKIARGVHQLAAASDTVATGLATVVAVIVSFQDAPTANIFAVAGDVGDQSAAPVAGSVLIKSYKTPATPTAATVFTDNIKVGWIAVGT